MWVVGRLPGLRSRAQELNVPRPLAAAAPGLAAGAVASALALAGVIDARRAALVAGACLLLAAVRALVAINGRAALRRKADALLRTGVRVHPQSALLPWRAAELTSARNRRILAGSLCRIVRDLERPARRTTTSAVPLDRPAVAPHAGLLRELAGRLAAVEAPVAPVGMVLVGELLTDGIVSPLYADGDDQEVGAALKACLRSLDGGPSFRGAPAPVAPEHRRAA